MATRKKTLRATKPKAQKEIELPSYYQDETVTSEVKNPRSKKFWIIATLIIVVAAALGILLKNRGLIMAASVNGMPVSRFELNQRLTDRFGDQMLEAIIGETIITQEAQKKGVTITNDEMSKKVAEIETSVGGKEALEQSLSLQGLSRNEFENQVRIQLLIDKMLGSEVSVSAEEVDAYLKENTTTLIATGEAEKKLEAESQLKNNKMSQLFVEWFNKLKESAKVEKYL